MKTTTTRVDFFVHMRPMAVTRVTKFQKCVNSFKLIIITIIIINFIKSAQNRTNIGFALCE